MADTREVTVAKKKIDTVPVKIWYSIYRQAKVVAAYRDIDLSEYLSMLLEKPVQRDFEKSRETNPEDLTARD